MKSIGIDPGTHPAICVVEVETMRVVALIGLKKVMMLDVKEVVEKLLPEKTEAVWFVEQQFGKMWKGKVIVNDLITQVENRCKWTDTAELLGYPFEVVYPNTWRAVTFVGAGKHKAEEWKKIAKDWAIRTLSGQGDDDLQKRMSEHKAEAMGIAWYGAIKLRTLKKTTKRKKIDNKKKIL